MSGIIQIVAAPGEGSEDRRNTADLEVEVALGPRANAHIERVRLGRIQVVGADLGKKNYLVMRAKLECYVQPQEPEKVSPIIGLVEIAGVFG